MTINSDYNGTISCREYSAILFAVRKAYEWRNEHPEVVELFEDMSLDAIASYFVNDGLADVRDDSIRRHVVRNVLLGNDDETIGPVFPGQIDSERYSALVVKHRQAAGRVTGSLGLGAHKLSGNELSDASRNSARKRGQTPWELGEIWFALSLKGDGERNSYIAQAVNEYWHGGEEVRGWRNVSELFRRGRDTNWRVIRNY